MAFKNISSVSLGISILVLLGCQSPQKSDTEKASKVWAGKMQGLAVEVQDLIPYIYSRQDYFDPANRTIISSGLKKMASQAHAISPEMGEKYFGSDPLAAYSLQSMQEDLTQASEAYSVGRVEYSRSVAKAATAHCFRCHSLTKEGGAANGWDVSQLSTLKLSPLEKVDLLVAARQYDNASKYLESLMGDPTFVQGFPFDFETALRKYLSLMIRAENNPERPLKELDRILAFPNLPYYVAEQARAWRASLVKWAKDSKGKKSQKDLLGQARDRIRRATDGQQYAKDHAGDIEYLRATTLLHEYLRTAKDPAKTAEAYFLLGQAYEVLDELGDWNLHEVYYENCVRKVPRSDLAKRCFGRLEASVYMGFSGSSGVHVPANERDRLKKLRDLM